MVTYSTALIQAKLPRIKRKNYFLHPKPCSPLWRDVIKNTNGSTMCCSQKYSWTIPLKGNANSIGEGRLKSIILEGRFHSKIEFPLGRGGVSNLKPVMGWVLIFSAQDTTTYMSAAVQNRTCICLCQDELSYRKIFLNNWKGINITDWESVYRY